jgi:hypothetical protein
MFDAPPALRPLFTARPPCVLKKLITVKVEKPAPLTVIVDPYCVTRSPESALRSGTDTALLFTNLTDGRGLQFPTS